MKAQTPAKGVFLVNEWGTSKMYKAVCECGNDDCAHTIDIEAEDTGVAVTIYTKSRTNSWTMDRWTHIWKLLIKGYTEFETCILMDRQVALNYANALQSAVNDVEELRKIN